MDNFLSNVPRYNFGCEFWIQRIDHQTCVLKISGFLKKINLAPFGSEPSEKSLSKNKYK